MSYLTKLSVHLPAPYKVLSRGTDQYGFVAFDGSYYWVPGTQCADVKVLQYSNRLEIYLARVCLVGYPLPADGVHNQRFSPPDRPPPPHQPRHRTLPAHEEEKRLRALAPMPPAPSYFSFCPCGFIVSTAVFRLK